MIGLVLIILVLMVLAITSVNNSFDNNHLVYSGSNQESGLKATLSSNATATFGAEQFHLQLTAIAGEGP